MNCLSVFSLALDSFHAYIRAAIPTPGYALLTIRLGAAEQRVRLLHAENLRLLSQLAGLSALIRA